jgi:hypothetical protein
MFGADYVPHHRPGYSFVAVTLYTFVPAPGKRQFAASAMRKCHATLTNLAHVLFACSASNRLSQYVSGRQDGMRRSQHQQQPGVAFGSTARNRSPSTSPGPVERMAGPASPPGPLDPSFYRRQEALLQRRAELAAQRRESDEDDLTECTCEWGWGLRTATS